MGRIQDVVLRSKATSFDMAGVAAMNDSAGDERASGSLQNGIYELVYFLY